METEDYADIFWTSAYHWERLNQRFLPGFRFEVAQEETLSLFPLDHASDWPEGCRLLNAVIADSITLLGLYQKHYWLVRDQGQHELERILHRHACEQIDLIDVLAHCVHLLGGVAISDSRHVAEITTIPLTPDGFEDAPAMLYRILEAHRIIAGKIHQVLARGAEIPAEVTNRRLICNIRSRHERQAWLIAEQLVGTLTII